MSNEEILARLRAEIGRTDTKTERECGSLLKEIAWVLLSKTDGTTTFVTSEQIVSTGRVDIVVLANSMQPGGSSCREAYIWELKAPQLKLFEMKTKNRAQPSSHLYSAETQLMHYCHSVKNDLLLLKRWRVLSPDNVRVGGVIIGSDKNFVKIKGTDEEWGRQLAHEALEIRDVYMYRPLNMKLWTWDNIVRLAEYQPSSHQEFTGDPNIPIDLGRTAVLSITTTANPKY